MEQQAIPDIFVSYSRKDIAFAKLIRESLIQSGFNVWIDCERIPTGVDWLATIESAIEASHTFLFIISKTSIHSAVCKDEITVALKNNKRIIPVIVDNLSPEAVGEFVPDLRKINWIIFERDHIFRIEVNPEAQSEKPEDLEVAVPGMPQYEQVLEKLSREIHTDWEWVTYHTRLQTEALRWSESSQNASYLLRGVALEEAERRLLGAEGKDPQPTLLQTQFATASRQDETRRQAEARLLEQKASRRQRLFLWAVGVGLVIAVVLGVIAWGQRNTAIIQGNLKATAQRNAEAASTRAIAESWDRATAEAQAIAESQQRATAQALAIAEAHQRATAEADALARAAIARSRQLAAASTIQLGLNQELALLLAIEAEREADTTEATIALRQALVHRGRTLKLLLGHGAEVYCAEWDPEGKRIVSAGADGTARVWDAESGRERFVLRGHTGAVVWAVWDSSGARIATASVDGTARVWDADTGRDLVTFNAHKQAIHYIAWSPDDSRLVTVGEDGSARVWDATSGEELVVFTAHGQPVRHAAWKEDGSRIVTSSQNGARVWDAKTGKELAILKPKVNNPGFAAWAGDGTYIMTGDLWYAYVWNLLATGPAGEETTKPEMLASHTHAAPGAEIGAIVQASWNSDDSRILSVSTNGTVEIWESVTGESLAFLVGHTDAVRYGAWSPDDTMVATVSDDGTARVWDSASGLEIARFTGHTQVVNYVAWDPRGTRLITASADGSVRIWAVDAVDELATLDAFAADFSSWSWDGVMLVTGADRCRICDAESGEQLAAVEGTAAWNPDGPGLLTTDDDGFVRVWDTAVYLNTGGQGPATITLPGVSGTWSPDGTRVTTTMQDKTVRVWDATSGEELATLSIDTGPPTWLEWSPDVTRIVTVVRSIVGATRSYKVQVWDATTGTRLLELPELVGIDARVSWNPTGTRLVTFGNADTAQVWDADNGTQLVLLSGHTNRVSFAAWSPDGSHIVTTSNDHTARVWDTGSGKELTLFSGHRGSVDYAAWNTDGTVIATAGWDATARIWNATDGRELAVIGGYLDAVRHVAWSPDGTRLAVTSWGGPPRVFAVPLVNMQAAACARAVRNMSESEWADQMGAVPYRETCPGKPRLQEKRTEQ